jgi:hypothetical protein
MRECVGHSQREKRSGAAVRRLLEQVAAKSGREAAGAGLQAPARTVEAEAVCSRTTAQTAAAPYLRPLDCHAASGSQ